MALTGSGAASVMRVVLQFVWDTRSIVTGADTSKAHVSKLAIGVAQLSTAFTAAGAAGSMAFSTMLKPMRDAISLATKVQNGLDEITTIMESNINATRQYGAEIRKLSAAYGNDLSNSIDAVYKSISAGIPEKNVMQALDVGAKLARVGVTDLSTAMDALRIVTNSYGIQVGKTSQWLGDAKTAAEQYNKIAAMLFETVDFGVFRMEDLTKVMGRFMPLARLTKVPLEEVNAVFAAMTRNGLNTREAATDLINILVSFYKPTNKAKEAVAALNEQMGKSGDQALELSAAYLAKNGLIKALEKLLELSGGSLDVLGQIFTRRRGLSGVAAALVDELRNVHAAYNDLTHAAGNIDEKFKQMQNTQYKLDVMTNSYNAVLATLGQTTLPGFGGALDIVNSKLSAMNKWLVEHRLSTAQWAASFYAATTAIGFGLSKVIQTLGMVGFALVGLRAAGLSSIAGLLVPIKELIGTTGLLLVVKRIKQVVVTYRAWTAATVTLTATTAAAKAAQTALAANIAASSAALAGMRARMTGLAAGMSLLSTAAASSMRAVLSTLRAFYLAATGQHAAMVSAAASINASFAAASAAAAAKQAAAWSALKLALVGYGIAVAKFTAIVAVAIPLIVTMYRKWRETTKAVRQLEASTTRLHDAWLKVIAATDGFGGRIKEADLQLMDTIRQTEIVAQKTQRWVDIYRGMPQALQDVGNTVRFLGGNLWNWLNAEKGFTWEEMINSRDKAYIDATGRAEALRVALNKKMEEFKKDLTLAAIETTTGVRAEYAEYEKVLMRIDKDLGNIASRTDIARSLVGLDPEQLDVIIARLMEMKSTGEDVDAVMASTVRKMREEAAMLTAGVQTQADTLDFVNERLQKFKIPKVTEEAFSTIKYLVDQTGRSYVDAAAAMNLYYDGTGNGMRESVEALIAGTDTVKLLMEDRALAAKASSTEELESALEAQDLEVAGYVDSRTDIEKAQDEHRARMRGMTEQDVRDYIESLTAQTDAEKALQTEATQAVSEEESKRRKDMRDTVKEMGALRRAGYEISSDAYQSLLTHYNELRDKNRTVIEEGPKVTSAITDEHKIMIDTIELETAQIEVLNAKRLALRSLIKKTMEDERNGVAGASESLVRYRSDLVDVTSELGVHNKTLSGTTALMNEYVSSFNLGVDGITSVGVFKLKEMQDALLRGTEVYTSVEEGWKTSVETVSEYLSKYGVDVQENGQLILSHIANTSSELTKFIAEAVPEDLAEIARILKEEAEKGNSDIKVAVLNVATKLGDEFGTNFGTTAATESAKSLAEEVEAVFNDPAFKQTLNDQGEAAGATLGDGIYAGAKKAIEDIALLTGIIIAQIRGNPELSAGIENELRRSYGLPPVGAPQQVPSGGYEPAPGTFIAGENGPELVNVSRNGVKVYTNKQTNKLAKAAEMLGIPGYQYGTGEVLPDWVEELAGSDLSDSSSNTFMQWLNDTWIPDQIKRRHQWGALEWVTRTYGSGDTLYDRLYSGMEELGSWIADAESTFGKNILAPNEKSEQNAEQMEDLNYKKDALTSAKSALDALIKSQREAEFLGSGMVNYAGTSIPESFYKMYIASPEEDPEGYWFGSHFRSMSTSDSRDRDKFIEQFANTPEDREFQMIYGDKVAAKNEAYDQYKKTGNPKHLQEAQRLDQEVASNYNWYMENVKNFGQAFIDKQRYRAHLYDMYKQTGDPKYLKEAAHATQDLARLIAPPPEPVKYLGQNIHAGDGVEWTMIADRSDGKLRGYSSYWFGSDPYEWMKKNAPTFKLGGGDIWSQMKSISKKYGYDNPMNLPVSVGYELDPRRENDKRTDLERIKPRSGKVQRKPGEMSDAEAIAFDMLRRKWLLTAGPQMEKYDDKVYGILNSKKRIYKEVPINYSAVYGEDGLLSSFRGNPFEIVEGLRNLAMFRQVRGDSMVSLNLKRQLSKSGNTLKFYNAMKAISSRYGFEDPFDLPYSVVSTYRGDDFADFPFGMKKSELGSFHGYKGQFLNSMTSITKLFEEMQAKYGTITLRRFDLEGDLVRAHREAEAKAKEEASEAMSELSGGVLNKTVEFDDSATAIPMDEEDYSLGDINYEMARGGRVAGGGRVLVGEEGPEVLELPGGAEVDPLGNYVDDVLADVEPLPVPTPQSTAQKIASGIISYGGKDWLYKKLLRSVPTESLRLLAEMIGGPSAAAAVASMSREEIINYILDTAIPSFGGMSSATLQRFIGKAISTTDSAAFNVFRGKSGIAHPSSESDSSIMGGVAMSAAGGGIGGAAVSTPGAFSSLGTGGAASAAPASVSGSGVNINNYNAVRSDADIRAIVEASMHQAASARRRLR